MTKSFAFLLLFLAMALNGANTIGAIACLAGFAFFLTK